MVVRERGLVFRVREALLAQPKSPLADETVSETGRWKAVREAAQGWF